METAYSTDIQMFHVRSLCVYHHHHHRRRFSDESLFPCNAGFFKQILTKLRYFDTCCPIVEIVLKLQTENIAIDEILSHLNPINTGMFLNVRVFSVVSPRSISKSASPMLYS